MPTTRYARSDGLSIAYQTWGDGDIDLIYIPGWVSNVEIMWDDPGLARFLNRLGTFARVISFDKRGTGMSDRVSTENLPALDERMDDVLAVMDAVGSTSATLLGHSEGGTISMLFAATYPERARSLILIGSYASRVWSEQYPWAPRPDDREQEIEETERTWGDPAALPDNLAPSRANDPGYREWLARYFRLSASPAAAAALLRMNSLSDVRSILPTIQTATLCLYRPDDADVDIEEGRWIASQIPDAHFVEIPGADHLLGGADSDHLLAEIEQFVTGHAPAAEPERVLSTILFTDIVDSTTLAANVGDQQYASLLARHNAAVRSVLARHRGREIKTLGDGFLATFDGPARAIRAALEISQAVHPLDLRVRAGVHTGLIDLLQNGDIGGIAVHIAARVSALAGPDEVLVSRTVKDLIAGSDIELVDRGSHPLKGVPDEWQLYAAV